MRIINFFCRSWMASLLWAKGINDANRLYSQGKYDEAAQTYQKAVDADAKNFLARYDLGTALYKKGDFDKSAGYLQQALADQRPALRLNAQYNLGNALYKAGMARENKDIDGAITSLENSLSNFDEVVKSDAKDADARYNRDIVRQQLERLKKKTEEQKQQKQQQNEDQKQKDKEQQKSQDQQQGQGGQDQQDQQQKDKQQGRQGQEDKAGEQKQGDQAQAEDAQSMSEKQAKGLLEEYERTDAPAGLLNFIPRKTGEQNVEKDW